MNLAVSSSRQETTATTKNLTICTPDLRDEFSAIYEKYRASENGLNKQATDGAVAPDQQDSHTKVNRKVPFALGRVTADPPERHWLRTSFVQAFTIAPSGNAS